MRAEEWRSVAGFPGYEVSSLGRVRSLRRRVPVIRRPEVDKDGALRITLRRDGAYVHCVIARLVCAAFNGAQPEDKPKCCHDDNDPTNNTPGNLRWDTQAGNMADKVRHGTRQRGSTHPRALIDEHTARGIKRLLARGHRHQDVADVLRVSKHIVSDISIGKTWGHA